MKNMFKVITAGVVALGLIALSPAAMAQRGGAVDRVDEIAEALVKTSDTSREVQAMAHPNTVTGLMEEYGIAFDMRGITASGHEVVEMSYTDGASSMAFMNARDKPVRMFYRTSDGDTLVMVRQSDGKWKNTLNGKSVTAPKAITMAEDFMIKHKVLAYGDALKRLKAELDGSDMVPKIPSQPSRLKTRSSYRLGSGF